MKRRIHLSVSDQLYDELSERAKRSQQKVSGYVRGVLEREVARPPAEEVFARLRRREPVDLGRTAAELIHEERAERGTCQ